jgi:hypothetical protein
MMSIVYIFSFLVFLGSFVGFTSGLLGLGGGFITTPLLIYLFELLSIPEDYTVKIAVATSLFVVFLTSVAGTYRHALNKNVIWKYSLMLGVSGIFGSFIGVKIVLDYLSGNSYKIIFGLFLIIISIKMLIDRNNREHGFSILNPTNPLSTMEVKKTDPKLIFLFGILAGISSSIFGIGGGIIIVPFLTLIMGIPMKKSIGTSLAMMIIISLSGLIGYLTSSNPLNGFDNIKYLYFVGYVSLFVGIPIAIASMLLSQFGAKLSNKFEPEFLKKLLGIILLLVGVKMIF